MLPARADPTIRRQVIASARQLMAADEHIGVGRIADAAGVSRATFYRHFGSREALLRAIDREPPPDARRRILEAAAEMLVASSLRELSMDGLARAAGVSRATLYRLFPGKPALFRALIEAYSPFEDVLQTLARHREQPPEVVLRQVAQALARSVASRHGVVRAILLEVTSGSRQGLAGAQATLPKLLGALVAYLSEQMSAGRIRRMSPLLALQLVIGPAAFHLLTRPSAEQIVGLDIPMAEAIDELVTAALDGLRGPNG